MISISIIITLIYLILTGSFAFGFDKIPVFKSKNIEAKTNFSILIPFRNEAENLPDLLNSIASLDYPNHLYEIIFIDDDSDDDSREIITRFLSSIRNDIKITQNIRTSNSPKKDAITTAIKQAKTEWIITTDADCILSKKWLNFFDAFIQKNKSKCIVAPVTYTHENSFLNRFQLLDILSLQGATIGGFGIKKPFLCNGANFAYQKDLFIELNGFSGNNTIASGDDIFFLEKAIKSHPKQVHYLKSEDAIVTTKSQPSWETLKEQRIRWAAKTSAYNNWFGKLTGIIVLLMNALIITLITLSILNIFNIKTLAYILIIKLNIDFLLIYKSATFFNQKNVLKTYILSSILYPFFSVYIAFISIFKSYKWKDRTFKK